MVFFAAVLAVYFLLPARWGWLILLVASCIFYMSIVPWYILILGFIILVDFFVAHQIEKTSGRTKTYLLWVSIAVNIGTLFFFKYFNFFNANISGLAQMIGWNYPIHYLKIILPIGLSFHTFQSLSYMIEVYRGKYPAERHLGKYALYVMFFPQLVAGPIERPQNLLPQFHQPHRFDYDRFISGLALMSWGYIKKIVIADRLASSVDYVYGHLGASSGGVLVVTVIFFAFQLYADFSGYTDIAIGAARILGFKLSPNFNFPYIATSVADFWRRWHISLSNWIRDYVYYPLAFSVKKNSRGWLYLTVLITFLASGLWHGAGWTFVIMGALFGSFIVFSIVTKKYRLKIIQLVGLEKFPALLRASQILITFCLVSVSWIFFRAPNLTDAFYIVTHLFLHTRGSLGISQSEIIMSVGGILFLLGAEGIYRRILARKTLITLAAPSASAIFSKQKEERR